MKSLTVEPARAADSGPCQLCGGVTRRAWGFVCDPDRAVAAYVVQWTVGRAADHGAMFDLILGPRGDGTSVPIGNEAFAAADAALAQDGRIAELLGDYRLFPPRQPRRRK